MPTIPWTSLGSQEARGIAGSFLSRFTGVYLVLSRLRQKWHTSVLRCSHKNAIAHI